MNPPNTTPNRRLRATLWTALAALLPFSAHAEPVVFRADFPSGANTVGLAPVAPDPQLPSVITPAGATWYGMYNKANGALSVDANGLVLSSAGSTSAVIEFAGRITKQPISLAAVGDHIELTGSFYTGGLTNIAIGLFNSGGVDPLVTRSDGVAMLNNGLVGSLAASGGTLGWTGYRAMSTGASAGGSLFVARPAQTVSPTSGSYELLSVGTGGFNTPAAISVGSATNSPSIMTWKLESALTQYDFVYRIQRSSATVLAFTFTITNPATSTVVFSTTGSTTAAAAQPGAITSTFDAVGIGGRVDTGSVTTPSNSSTVYLQYTALKVTARNADIARIDTQPVAQNIPQGGSGSVSVAALGAAPLSYQWYKGGSPISGATAATYPITDATSENAGDYSVVVTNAFGSETSQTVTVNVSSLSAPVITTEPVAQNVDAGTPLTLSVTASGVPTPTYQWYRNTTLIPDATLATYTVANATEAHAGNYHVVVTNSQGADTSATVAVTINTAAPAITTPPSPVSVNVGQPVNLSVVASGLPAPTFQWFKGSDAIPGATASTYSIPSATTALAGTYSVVATNTYGSAPSAGVLVTVNVVNPTVTTQPPATLAVHYGKRVTLTAAYAGSAPLTYQWYKGVDAIPGAIGASYTIASATPANAGDYHVVVTNEGASTPSNTTTVSVVFSSETPVFATNFATDTLNNPATPITAGSTSWFILAGRAAKNSSVGDDPLTTEEVETRPLTLTWETPAGSAIVETAARFSATPVALTNTGDFIRLRATLTGTNILNFCFGLFDSNGVSPVALDGSVDGATLGSTTVVGLGTQNWVGYRSAFSVGNTSGDVGTRPAQTGTTSNRGQELVFPTNSTGAAFGQPVGVPVGVQPSLASAFAFTDNATYTLEYVITLTATNQYGISYALYSGASATGTPLYTSNSITTAASALPSAVTTEFDALSIGLRNSAASTSPTIVISNLSVEKGVAVAGVAPDITTQPSSQSLAVGDTLTLVAAATGTPAPTFQWYKNNEIIPTATGTTFTIESVATTDSGDYKVIATNPLGDDPSNLATILVGSATAYSNWSSGQGLTAGVNDGASQDPDADGIVNLLEFALGGNPLAANSAILPVVSRSGANLVLSFDFAVAVKSDYIVSVESSTDLTGAWSPVAHGVGGATVIETTVDASTNHLVATVPASGARTFLRVKVAPKP